MFISQPKTSEASNGCLLYITKQYATEGHNIPLKKNWSDTWCTLPCRSFDGLIADLLHYEVRSDDVFLVTFMKSGTTWMQETAWLLTHNLDFEHSKREHLMARCPHLEHNGIFAKPLNALELTKTVPSPRLIKSHLPANMLPQLIWKCKQKIIYVARNCKDVIISCFHFSKGIGYWQGDNLEDFASAFMNNEIAYTDYWSHLVDFWQMRHEPFICFVTYEEMKIDLEAVIKRLCTFLERPQLTTEEMQNLLVHLSFDRMKENKQTNQTCAMKELLPNPTDNFEFMRRGIVGSFRDEMTPELQLKIDNWSKNYLAQRGLTEEHIFGKL